jgi:lipopolysaccharide/colanic/teichoic acid biosynthesis glycosyltransferase
VETFSSEVAHRSWAGAVAVPETRRDRVRRKALAHAEPHPVSETARRALNVSVAAVSLVVLAPLFLLLALLVGLSSPGPIIYTQYRVGVDRRRSGSGDRHWRRRHDHGGRLFRIYKFRTMYVDDSDRQVWAQKADPRVTPIGRVLRGFRLDEFPQLFNVLRGDMNIVGPRPEQPKIFQELREQVDSYQVRQRVLPGITGWAQVNHHYDADIEDVRRKIGLDLEYVRRRSAAHDLQIMLRTIPVVVTRQGAC